MNSFILTPSNPSQTLNGEHIIQERGLIDVKGKGQQRTFWLTGRAIPLKSSSITSALGGTGSHYAPSDNGSHAHRSTLVSDRGYTIDAPPPSTYMPDTEATSSTANPMDLISVDTSNIALEGLQEPRPTAQDSDEMRRVPNVSQVGELPDPPPFKIQGSKKGRTGANPVSIPSAIERVSASAQRRQKEFESELAKQVASRSYYYGADGEDA